MSGRRRFRRVGIERGPGIGQGSVIADRVLREASSRRCGAPLCRAGRVDGAARGERLDVVLAEAALRDR
jgi:hypothetical protein